MIAILQARMSSSRLPGKVLKPILGRPMLHRQIERVLYAASIERLIVATSCEAADDPIAQFCRGANIACFRGHAMDVLDRFYQASRQFAAEHIVRLTGDCPLTDPSVIDQVVHYYINGDYDYASNVVERTFPDGLDVEVLRATALEQAWRDATEQRHREHVPLFVREHPNQFRIGSFRGPLNVFHYRWTVDELNDFEFARMVYEALYPTNPQFTWLDVMDLLDRRPDIAQVNVQCGVEETRTNPRRLAS